MKLKHIKPAGPNDPIYRTGLVIGGNYSSEPSTDTKAENSTSESPKPNSNSNESDAPATENKD